jgi:hypothetical protein
VRHGVVRSSPVIWVAYVIMPLFALANAGVSLDGVNLANEGSLTVMLGVSLALLLGARAPAIQPSRFASLGRPGTWQTFGYFHARRQTHDKHPH